MQDFSVIFAKYVLAFIGDKEKFLNKVKELLSPAGRFIIISPNKVALPEPKKHIGLEHEEVNKTLQNVFDHVDSEEIHGDYIYYCSI